MTAFAGQVVRASDTEVLWARKLADESLTNTTTLQSDDALLLPVEANAVYEFLGLVAYTSANNPDIAIAFAFPSGGTCHWAGKGADQASNAYGTAGTAYNGGKFGAGSNSADFFCGSTSLLTVLITGVLITGPTSGNLQLRWAQGTADGTVTTTVKAGSFLRAERRE